VEERVDAAAEDLVESEAVTDATEAEADDGEDEDA